MNDKPNSPKYYRLLEKGETIEKGDIWPRSGSNSMIPTDLGGKGIQSSGQPLLRPVQVDEWISYAERKPTKEDFEPTGEILALRDGWPFIYHMSEISDSPHLWFGELFWRRITPPQPTKPKSVKLEFTNRVTSQDITPNPDGTAKLSCGDTLAAKSIDEFIAARNEAMKQ